MLLPYIAQSKNDHIIAKKERQPSGVITIMYHTLPRKPYRKVTKTRKDHIKESS